MTTRGPLSQWLSIVHLKHNSSLPLAWDQTSIPNPNTNHIRIYTWQLLLSITKPLQPVTNLPVNWFWFIPKSELFQIDQYKKPWKVIVAAMNGVVKNFEETRRDVFTRDQFTYMKNHFNVKSAWNNLPRKEMQRNIFMFTQELSHISVWLAKSLFLSHLICLRT